jgi:hypothetical protein
MQIVINIFLINNTIVIVLLNSVDLAIVYLISLKIQKILKRF